MKYTEYFSNEINNTGVPQLSLRQFKRYMNIVYLESSIKTLDELKKKNQRVLENIEDTSIKLQKTLDKETMDLLPKTLLRAMLIDKK